MIYKDLKIEGTKLNRSIFFVSIIVVKIILMGLFSSDYQNLMFIPFVNCFLAGQNPYEFYYQNGLINSFPYLPLMLFIESIGGGYLKLLSVEAVFLRNIIFKIPLLLCDIVSYFILRKMNVRYKYAIIFYFCSPIIFYSTYVHGQLDIIPTAIFLVSIYFLINWKKDRNLVLYSLFVALAIACKSHILAALPILFFYISKKKNYIVAIESLIISFLIVVAVSLPFFGDGFINTVLLNKEQSVLTLVNIDYGQLVLALPIVVLTIVYLNVYDLNYFNKDLLISMLSMLFSIFLICVSPMPGWYVWIVPLYALYFAIVDESKYKVMTLYALFNVLYIVFFIFLHQTDYVDIYFLEKSLQSLKINNITLTTIVFTIMVGTLCVIVYKIYNFGIASNMLYKRRGNSFVIGIAGDSGAGKSKLLEKIENLFGTERDILFIEGDGDHRWARNDDNWEQYTALNPQANYLYKQADNIRDLKRGNHVLRRDYDHNTGRFTHSKRVDSKKYIVLCGLHSLYLPALRDELDLKIFMDTDNELRNYWKIQRDTQTRGYSKEAIVKQIEKRIPDAEKYIYPQKEYADLVITYFDNTLKSCYEDDHKVALSVKFTFGLNVDVEPLTNVFYECGINTKHIICDDFLHQILEFDALDIDEYIDFEKIAEKIVPQYEDFFTYSPKWGERAEGIIQIVLLYMISLKMKG